MKPILILCLLSLVACGAPEVVPTMQFVNPPTQAQPTPTPEEAPPASENWSKVDKLENSEVAKAVVKKKSKKKKKKLEEL